MIMRNYLLSTLLPGSIVSKFYLFSRFDGSQHLEEWNYWSGIFRPVIGSEAGGPLMRWEVKAWSSSLFSVLQGTRYNAKVSCFVGRQLDHFHSEILFDSFDGTSSTELLKQIDNILYTFRRNLERNTAWLCAEDTSAKCHQSLLQLNLPAMRVFRIK